MPRRVTLRWKLAGLLIFIAVTAAPDPPRSTPR
jgi:hypothetical protein